MATMARWLTLLVVFGLVFLSVALEETNSNKDERTKRKRSFYPWRSRAVTPQYTDSITKWKAPTYQLSRPYYIPIYGAPGRIPIYYPPQQILLNPGSPQDNPFPRQKIYLPPINQGNKDFKGPSYLPPNTKKPLPDNRFGEFEDLPVWGDNSVENRVTTARPAATRPTRLPKPKVEATLPPLVHKEGDSSSSNSGNTGTNHLAAEEQPELSPGLSMVDEPQSGPTSCAWAIVNCCSVQTGRVVEACFEQRGCPGPFWGASPCEGDFARAALASALGYYNS